MLCKGCPFWIFDSSLKSNICTSEKGCVFLPIKQMEPIKKFPICLDCENYQNNECIKEFIRTDGTKYRITDTNSMVDCGGFK